VLGSGRSSAGTRRSSHWRRIDRRRATAKGGLSGRGKAGFRIYIVAPRGRGGPLPPALRISHAGCQAPLAERLGEGGQNQFFGEECRRLIGRCLANEVGQPLRLLVALTHNAVFDDDDHPHRVQGVVFSLGIRRIVTQLFTTWNQMGSWL
jgi:hypothetical protein